jgi:hypothetical protein
MLVSRVGWGETLDLTVQRIRSYITGLPLVPSTKGIFVTLNRRNKMLGCLGTFAGNDCDLIERVMTYTLRSAYEDRRFSDHQLRSADKISEVWLTDYWSFTTTVLDTAFEIHPDDFWRQFIAGKHGIILKYKGKSATFLPKVILRWWPEVPKESSSRFICLFVCLFVCLFLFSSILFLEFITFIVILFLFLEIHLMITEFFLPCKSKFFSSSSFFPCLTNRYYFFIRLRFEEDVFGALLKKMGHSSIPGRYWKQGIVHLYDGIEHLD